VWALFCLFNLKERPTIEAFNIPEEAKHGLEITLEEENEGWPWLNAG